MKGGFPKRRSELFDYEAVIIGSVPASDFSDAQMELLHDFVVERGGGLLMLGGPKALAQGGYGSTPLADVLPVRLPGAGSVDAAGVPQIYHERFSAMPTTDGLLSPLLQLDPDPAANRRCWEQLPKLVGYNPVGPAKLGASVLAVHPLHTAQSPRILLATERVGRGRAAVLATASTWKWRMGLPHADSTPERFWRQFLRWLSLQTPEPVTIALGSDHYAPGETVRMTIEARDSSFVAQPQASVSVKLIRPDGRPELLSSSPVLGHTGIFETQLVATSNGLYQIEATAEGQNGKLLGKGSSAFLVEPSRAELANADLQSALLQRMAEITGGRYFPIDKAADLPASITASKSAYSTVTEQDIWDAPMFFLLIMILLAAEWFIRRSRGLS